MSSHRQPLDVAQPTDWSAGDVDADGVRLHFHRTGTGELPPLVLAHGLSDNGLCWRRVARALDSEYDIVMIDARNHGESATAPASPELLAADVAAVISALGFERPMLMGHSVGAHTAAVLASRHPDLVSRLVLEDPPWTADREVVAGDDDSGLDRREPVREWLESLAVPTDDEMAELGRTQHGEWPDEEFPDWIASNRQVRVEAADGLSVDGWAEVVAGIRCPTLVLHGDADRGGIVTLPVARRITELNPLVSTRAIDDAGHNVRRENFEQFLEVAGAFLRHPAS